MAELNAKSKCLGENLKFCTRDPYDVINTNRLLKIDQCAKKIIIFFVGRPTKKKKGGGGGAFKVKSKFFNLFLNIQFHTLYPKFKTIW